jgi:hypothetical protein
MPRRQRGACRPTIEHDGSIFDTDGVTVEPSDRAVRFSVVVDASAIFDDAVDTERGEPSDTEEVTPCDLLDEHDLDTDALWCRRILTTSLAPTSSLIVSIPLTSGRSSLPRERFSQYSS